MEKNNVDPAFKYTDANIKKLKRALTKELEKLQDSILQTQRFLAKLQIRVIHNESISQEEVYSKAQARFISQVTSAFLKVKSSEQPLDVAEEFRTRRWRDLKNLGVEVVTIE